MGERDLGDFRPLAELDHQATVEFRLFNGKVVHGRMMVGIVTPASRSYYLRERGEWRLIRADSITGWRNTPEPRDWRGRQREAA